MLIRSSATPTALFADIYSSRLLIGCYTCYAVCLCLQLVSTMFVYVYSS